jgi:hypothetical protein
LISAFPIYTTLVLTKIFPVISALSLTAEQESQLFYYRNQSRIGFDDLIKHEGDPTHLNWKTRKGELIDKVSKGLAGQIDNNDPELEIKDKHQICAYIVDKLTEHNDDYDASIVYSILPPEFKDVGTSTRYGDKLQNSNSNNLQTYKQQTAITTLYELPAEEIKKGWKDAKAAVDHYETVAKHKQIALVGHKEREDPISTILPEPGKSELYYAALDVYQEARLFVDNWEGVVKKIEQFPIKDKKADRACARRLRSLANFFNGFGRLLPTLKDEKYGQSLWGWCQTVVWEEGYGKHAGAVKSKIEPIGETKKPRPFTRERVGDAKERYWNDMQAFGKAMQIQAWWQGLIDWRDKFGEVSQRIADRRNREAPLLSETAFSAERS